MAAASEYALEPIRDGAEFTLYRARQRGNPSPVLVVAPTAEQPFPRVCDAWSMNTRSQRNLSPCGRRNLWRSRATKGGQSLNYAGL
jgi:hypothetical protein